MLKQILMMLPVLLAGILLGAYAREPVQNELLPAAPRVADGARDFDHAADYQQLEQMISSLTEIVNLEVGERRRLEEQVAALSEQIERLVEQRTGAGAVAADEEQRLAAVRDRARQNVRRALPAGAVTEERLTEAGFSPEVAAQLKREMDRVALDRLYLRDQAAREGWLNSSRYRDELQALNARQTGLRDSLSPEDYDRFLYATGRPNRISVGSVLTGSPADESGILPGDSILSYDGQRVFSPAEIRRQTSAGSPGALVQVEILRNGQRQVVYLPRGPLGVQMSSISAKP